MNPKFVLLLADLVICQFYIVDAAGKPPKYTKLNMPKELYMVEVRATQSGILTDINVKVGDAVQKGQQLFSSGFPLIAADYRVFDIAPVSGYVKSIRFVAGDHVNAKEVVLTIRPLHETEVPTDVKDILKKFDKILQ